MTFGPSGHWVHYPVHALIEGFGAGLSICLAFLFLLMIRFGRLPVSCVFLAAGFGLMGALDGTRAVIHHGEISVWLHSLGTFLGGLTVALIWMPARIAQRMNPVLLTISATATGTVIGLASALFPQFLPDMAHPDGISGVGWAMNIVGAVAFGAAALFFVRSSLFGARILCYLFLLFGAAGLAFLATSPWDATWWFWHGIRGAGFALAAVYFYQVLLSVLQDLKIERARFRDFAESTSDWSWETDSDNRFTWLSHQFRDHLNVPAEALIGRTRNELIDPERTGPQWKAHLECLEKRLPFHNFRYEFAFGDGGRRVVSISGRPVFDSAGRFMGYRGTGTNVTRQVEAEEARYAAHRKAEEASRAKSEFLAAMSHELRTPLNAMIGFSETIRAEMFGPLGNKKYAEYVADINLSANHLLVLINDILDITRIEAGKYRVDMAVRSVADLVAAAATIVGPKVDEKAQKLVIDLTPDAPSIIADERAMRQILINLMDNAVKFSSEGGTIAVRSYLRTDGSFVLAVEDSGIGIASEDIPTVLEPFGQVRQSAQISHEGTGLGLALVQKLIELQGGEVEIESTVGVGTVISLILPGMAVEATREAS